MRDVHLGLYDQARNNWLCVSPTRIHLEVAYTQEEQAPMILFHLKKDENEDLHVGAVLTLGRRE
ncbi:MAG: hypothetical protein H6625_11875 [Bdellovibrionaceae bacterium]|nr:hypothetical protein [Pseudobdellovibrionaceae bacterium]